MYTPFSEAPLILLPLYFRIIKVDKHSRSEHDIRYNIHVGYVRVQKSTISCEKKI